jgi:hypothetical protein
MDSPRHQIDPDEQLQAYLRALHDDFRRCWTETLKRYGYGASADQSKPEEIRARFTYVVDGSRTKR